MATIDRLAGQYPDKEFASLCCNRGGVGLLHEGGTATWADTDGGLATTGNARRATGYSIAAYMTMLIAKQKTNLLAIEWYQGETDGMDASTVTKADYKNALADLFDRWRLVLPPIRIVVGLSDAPVSDFSNWTVIQNAQAEFSYDNCYYISATGLDTLGSEPYHLNGQGQKDLGEIVASKIISINQ